MMLPWMTTAAVLPAAASTSLGPALGFMKASRCALTATKGQKRWVKPMRVQQPTLRPRLPVTYFDINLDVVWDTVETPYQIY